MAEKPLDTNAGQLTTNRFCVYWFQETQMSADDTTGRVFVRENTILPGGLIIETETFLPGWRAIKNCDGYWLGRKIEQAKWNFFYLAGDVKVTVLGREGAQTLRRAVRSVLAKPEAEKFNSLEITGTAASWFLGVPFVTITANFRHIQQSLALDPGNVYILKTPTAPEGVMATNKYGTLVTNS
jgi:hypothetical protein